jgi:hypothetical protein
MMENTKIYRQGFRKGYSQIKHVDYLNFKREALIALGLAEKSTIQLYNYRDGKVEPKISNALELEKVFEKYGVSKNEIWGTE